jgi:transposase-like protein
MGNPLTGYRYPEAERKRWAKLYAKGQTVRQIADEANATRATVQYWLEQAGVRLRGNVRHFDRKAILREVKRGKLTQDQIAAKFGCSQRLVSDVARGKVRA